MIKCDTLPNDIFVRLDRLGPVLDQDDRIVFAYLFGGLAKGEAKPLSDVDVAIFLDGATNAADAKLNLIGVISDALGTDEFDLVVLNNASLSIAGRILRTRKILVDKQPHFRHTFESRIMREFFDFRRKEQDILFRRFA